MNCFDKTLNMEAFLMCVFVYCALLISGIYMTTSDQTNRQLTTVPSGLSSATTILKLTNNLLRGLDENSFRNYPNLKRLYVDRNRIEVIQDGTFDQQTQLVRICLSHNPIRQLPASFGPSTGKLLIWEMYTGFTTIAMFKFPYFAAFARLFRLELGGNSKIFADCSILPSSLNWFRGSDGTLPTMPDLSYIPNVAQLFYYNSAMEQIPQQHINTNTKVTVLHLAINKLTSIPSFSHMSLLETLWLEENMLQEISRDHISGLISLVTFKLKKNLLVTMPNVSYLPQLELLDVSENDITAVPESTLLGIPKLLTLKLNDNKISVLGDISALWAEVRLENNNLTTLPDLYNMRLEELTLEGNPMSCNQSLCWLRMWPWNKTLPTLDDALCTTPSDLNELKAMRIHPTQLQCFNGMLIIQIDTVWLEAYISFSNTLNITLTLYGAGNTLSDALWLHEMFYIGLEWHLFYGMGDDVIWKTEYRLMNECIPIGAFSVKVFTWVNSEFVRYVRLVKTWRP